MRWKDHDAVLNDAVAWQEQRDGHWVTVVLLTDRPVPRGLLVPGKQPSRVMEEAGVQGVALPVMTGGVPLSQWSFDIGYHDRDGVSTSSMNGSGGFVIESQTATGIKGRVTFNAFAFGARDENACSVSFDAPVLRGDAKKMAAEGEALGVGGGQPGKDLLAVSQAYLAMDYAAISAYASPDIASLLADAKNREKNLAMLKRMTPPQMRVLAGLRQGNSARLYWVQQRPGARDMLCVGTLELMDGRWRSTETICSGE